MFVGVGMSKDDLDPLASGETRPMSPPRCPSVRYLDPLASGETRLHRAIAEKKILIFRSTSLRRD